MQRLYEESLGTLHPDPLNVLHLLCPSSARDSRLHKKRAGRATLREPLIHALPLTKHYCNDSGRRAGRPRDSGAPGGPGGPGRSRTAQPSPTGRGRATRTRTRAAPAPRRVFPVAPFRRPGKKRPCQARAASLAGTGSGPQAGRRKRASDPSAAGGLEGRRPRCSLLAGRPAERAAGRAPRRRGAMKLYSLSVLYKAEQKAVLLKAAYDVSSFSFFQRSR